MSYELRAAGRERTRDQATEICRQIHVDGRVRGTFMESRVREQRHRNINLSIQLSGYRLL